jgi:hypothetical protein
MWKVEGVTPGAACSGGGAGGVATEAVWQADSRMAENARTGRWRIGKLRRCKSGRRCLILAISEIARPLDPLSIAA